MGYSSNTTVTELSESDAEPNSEKKASLRDRVRDAADRKVERVYIDAWGVEFESRSMTGNQRRELVGRHISADGETLDVSGFEIDVIIHTAYDPDTGELAFRSEDADWMGEKLAGALVTLANAGLRVSGLDVESIKQAGKASIGIRS